MSNYIELRVYFKEWIDSLMIEGAASELQDRLAEIVSHEPDIYTKKVTYEIIRDSAATYPVGEGQDT